MSTPANAKKTLNLTEAIELLQVREEQRTFPMGLKGLRGGQLDTLGIILANSRCRLDVIHNGTVVQRQALQAELTSLLPDVIISSDPGLPATIKTPQVPKVSSLNFFPARPGISGNAPRPSSNNPG